MPPTSQYAANASQSRIAAITAALGDSDGSEEEDELAKLRAQIRKVYCPYKVSHHLIA
jgi:transposase-like protein